MPVRESTAIWNGSLTEGKGSMRLASGAYEGEFTRASRFEEAKGTNPEELIGAAHAGCFSMALSAELSKVGYTVEEINTEAIVSMEKGEEGFGITRVKLVTKARVKDIEMEEFAKFASGAKQNCPVSRALSGVEILLEAHLLK